MFYQTNPLYAVIIIIIFLGLYLLFKRRKSSGTRSNSAFFSGRGYQQNDLVDLILAQQLLSSSKTHDSLDSDGPDNKTLEIERTKKEILELLEN